MIDRFFSTEGPVYRVLDKMGQMVVASVLWMLGCIPIVTIATSTTAFYYAIIKVVRRERGAPLVLGPGQDWRLQGHFLLDHRRKEVWL